MSRKSKHPEKPSERTVYVCGSKFSKSFLRQAALDYQKGVVGSAGQIMLPDGQVIQAGPTYETKLSPQLLQMIKRGILQASSFGRLRNSSTR